MSQARFQVDLGGLIELLSAHLYSGAQVFVRELLQNAVDAITARRALDPDCPATIRFWLEAGEDAPVLAVSDTGIGLTATQAQELLATIGASSKRDAWGGRAEFIGQFGIGMLATFMVADSIEVTSRSVAPAAAPIRWTGFSNGEFELTQTQLDLPVGTTIRMQAKRGAEHWFDEATLVALAEQYGSLLPFEVCVRVSVEGSEPLWRRVTKAAPWLTRHASRGLRAASLAAYCEEVFGFTPLTTIDLALPAVGLTGVAFVLPQAVAPAAGQHRVYLKGMLLGSRVDGVLPDWAFFVRAVVSADGLAPAASREQLRMDEVLLGAREALGEQIKAWAKQTLTQHDHEARQFIQIHHLALRALALTDETMLDVVSSVLPFETTDGIRTLREVAADGEVLFAASTEAYRRVSAVARAQGVTVVNAGYVYDADLMQRLAKRPGWRVRELTGDDIAQVLRLISPERETQIGTALMAAREVLAEQDCDVIVRSFEPSAVPALLLRDGEGEHRRDLAREREAEPSRWGGLLDVFATSAARSRTLVLNDSASNVRRLFTADDPRVFNAALNTLYLSAVLLAGEGLCARETVALNESLAALLDAALRPDPLRE